MEYFMKPLISTLIVIILFSATSLSLASDKILLENSYESSEAWMNDVLGGTKAVRGPLALHRFADPTYILLKKIVWTPNSKKSDLPEVVVPKGFVTDLTSIPPIFYSALRPDGEYTYAAIIHDYLYWQQKTTREDADIIFREAMNDFGINKYKVGLIYRAVRWGGMGAWDGNRRSKEKGERRFLRKFPQDPAVTWAKWKEKSGVFKD